MRRNPRPLRPVDRRKLVMNRIEREARAIASEAVILGAMDRDHDDAIMKRGVLTLNKPVGSRK